jgi:hypothetical protein
LNVKSESLLQNSKQHPVRKVLRPLKRDVRAKGSLWNYRRGLGVQALDPDANTTKESDRAPLK